MFTNSPRWTAFLILALGIAPSLVHGAESPHSAEAIEFFEKKIRPLLVSNCYNCHSADTNAKGGLRVDDRNGLVVGGSSGAAIVPGKPDDSLLIQAVRYEGFEMPPNKKLSDEQIADLEKWVTDGAAWPRVDVPLALDTPNAKYDELKQNHWAWQPLKAVSPPSIQNTEWPRDDVDRFVLAQLESKNLQPVNDADKLALIRRVTFDLTGLPPSVDEIDAFLADDSGEALATVVDRLLASKAFGERWGRHWLDVGRFGESTGSARNLPYPQAWRYRDYVVDSFNADKPYNQFIREQIAGDLLPYETEQQREEQLIATGFLALGVKDVNQRFKVRYIMDNVDEQIDTVTRSVLAVTASCARCHDHKFDPIPTKDYYALAGIFQSTDLCAGLRSQMGGSGLAYYDTKMLLIAGHEAGHEPASEEKITAVNKKFEDARAEFQRLRDDPASTKPGPNGKPPRQVARQRMNKAQAELLQLTDPVATGAKVVLGARDSAVVNDTEVRIRGEAEKLGPVVSRGFLSVVQYPGQPQVSPDTSGRLELAHWLTDEQNPLASRVITNRIWQHLFGQGIVRSVDNFGVTGDAPSNPELLDHLAQRLVREGWSVKRLVRSIVLSRAYGLSADSKAENYAVDPDNLLIWRHTPRRLDAEEIRDAALVAAGKLDLSRPTSSPATKLKVTEIRNNGGEAKELNEHANASLYRSVYLPLVRGITPTALQVFDFAEQGMVSGKRETTTVAPQALFLLNDPFVRKRSLELANRVRGASETDVRQQIVSAYRITLGRVPTEGEIERAQQFLSDYEVAYSESSSGTDSLAVAQVAVGDAPASDATEDAAATAASEESKPKADDGKPAKPMPVIDPDQIITEDLAIAEEKVVFDSASQAAWASLCQALIGSAEFRYLR
jgi:hypothetical protein